MGHDSTPLQIDRFELQRRLLKLSSRPDMGDREWKVLAEVADIINRMGEEGDAGISMFYDHKPEGEQG